MSLSRMAVIAQSNVRLIFILLSMLIHFSANSQCSFSLFGTPVDKLVCRGGDAQLGVLASTPTVYYEFFGALRKVGGPLDGSGGSLSVETPVNSANSAGYYSIKATQGACTFNAGFNVYFGDIDDLSIYGWGGDSVAFRWASSGRAGYVRYLYSVSTEIDPDNIDFSEINETFDTSAIVYNLVQGTQYYVHVKVDNAFTDVNGNGNPVNDDFCSNRLWYTLPFKPCSGSSTIGSITPLDPVLCIGGNITLTASGSNNFQWYKDGALLPGAINSTHTVTQEGNYSTYIVNPGGCEGMVYSKYIDTIRTFVGSLTGGGNYCVGENFRLGLSGTKTNQVYEIKRNGIVVIPAFIGVGVHLNSYDPQTFELLPRTDTMWFDLPMTTSAAGIYTVTTSVSGCQPINFGNAVVGQLSSGTITPATATICSPGGVLLTATGGGTYQWKRNGVPVGSPTTTPTFTATQDGTYTVDITNGSCTSPAANNAIITASTPFGSITPLSGSICPTGSLILTATGGTTYQWFRNGVSQGPPSASATFTVTQTGTYSVIISIGSCSAPGTNQVTISAAASPTGTISPATATICAGEIQTLTATGGTSYEWFKDAISLGAPSPSATYPATLAGTYTVTIFNGGCSGPASNSALITVTPIPSGSITPLSASFCAGGSQLLTTSGGSSYEWFINGVSQGPPSASPSFLATVNGIYRVRIITGNCSAYASNNVNVTVNPLPSGTITPMNGSICPGNSVILTATGGTSYQWFRDNISQGPASPSPTFNATIPGIYTVIINNGTCSGPGSNSSNIISAPQPTGTISPATATICPGGSQLLTANGGTSYEWFRNGISQGPSSASATFNATQGGVYTVIINNSGCSGPASNNSTITVAALPAGTISPATATICAGGSQVFTANGGTSYEWFRNGISQGPSSPSANFVATLGGTYSVIINDGNCSGPASNTAQLIVNPLPTGAITPVNPTICEGSSIVLTASGGNLYEWFKNGISQGIAAASPAITVSTAGTYSVIITNGLCSAPAANTSTVTVAPLPTGTISPSTATICAGETQVFTATGGTSYEWLRNGISQGPSSSSAIFTASLPGDYSVIIFDGSCYGPATNTAALIITPLPVGNITPSSAAICAGSSQILTATGGTSYQWFRNGVPLAPAGPSSTFSATLAGTYSVIITNNNCSAPAANTSTITINPLPTGNITPVFSTICPGSHQQLQASGGVSYQWFRDATLIPSATLATYEAMEQGVYTVQIIDANSCRNMASNFSTVNFYSKPVASFTNNISCQDQAITFMNTSSSVNTGGVNYQWNFGDNSTSTLVTPVHTFTQAGTFIVTLIATSNTCPLLADTIKVPLVISPAIPGIKYPPARVVKNVASLISARNIGQAYVWQPPGGLSNPNIRTPIVTIPDDMMYRIRITSAGGCVTVDTLEVQAFSKADVFVPKAFTPNGNNANDLLRPVLVNVPVVHFFRVYNRWGQLVFQTQIPGEGWNGIYKNNQQPMETYTWSFEGKDVDGNIIKANGKSLLIR